jgi:hypothetical protein
MSAVPNLFEFIITEALEQDGATAESVAATIAASDPFLKAVRKGMDNQTPDGGVLAQAQVMRMALSQALGGGTAGEMNG